MQLNEIKYFLDNMFTNPEEFKAINGISNSLDAKYMLVADVISENCELLANLIQEQLNLRVAPYVTTNIVDSETRKTSF